VRKIDPHIIYTMAEAKELLSPHVNYETLRAESDLVTMPGGGLWGTDLIAAIDQMQDSRRRKRGGASRSIEKEQDDHETESTSTNGPDNHGQLGGRTTKGEDLEGERKGGRPRVHNPRPRKQPVADQCRKLRRLAQEADADSIES
jgi:hypothetical protein